MGLITQISGGYDGNKQLAFQLKKKLEDIGIVVTHPKGDGSIFLQKHTMRGNAADRQNLLRDMYSAITICDFHIVCNATGKIGQSIAQEIIYAMYKHKPVVALRPITFYADTDQILCNAIRRESEQIVTCDVSELSDENLKTFISELGTAAALYALTSAETTHIRAYRQKINSTGINRANKNNQPSLREVVM